MVHPFSMPTAPLLATLIFNCVLNEYPLSSQREIFENTGGYKGTHLIFKVFSVQPQNLWAINQAKEFQEAN